MIFKYILTTILIIVSLVIQGHSSFDVLRIAGVKPDLIFIVIVYLSFIFPHIHGQFP